MKPWMIVAICLIVVGMILCLVALLNADFDFSKLDTANTVSNTHNISEEFDSIKIETVECNVSFVPGEQCQIVTQESEKQPISVEVSDGALTIRQEDQRKWYDHIGIFWTEQKVTVYLPQAEYDKLSVNTTTGIIRIGEEYTFADVSLTSTTGKIQCSSNVTGTYVVSATTGDISLEKASPESLSVACTTARITLSHIAVTNGLNANTTTGKLSLSNCTAGTINAECTTGKLTLTDTVAVGQLKAETSTGDIMLTNCDAATLDLESSTGAITATLLTEKVVFAETGTGKINVPKNTTGGTCTVETGTGNITVKFA